MVETTTAFVPAPGTRPKLDALPWWCAKDASADNTVRFFNATKSNDVVISLSFIAINDVRKLPEMVNLLVQPDEKRSEKMVQIADWFGVYSSPRNDKYSTCAMVYTANKPAVMSFALFEKQFSETIDLVRKALIADPTPGTVLKLVSRFVAL